MTLFATLAGVLTVMVLQKSDDPEPSHPARGTINRIENTGVVVQEIQWGKKTVKLYRVITHYNDGLGGTYPRESTDSSPT